MSRGYYNRFVFGVLMPLQLYITSSGTFHELNLPLKQTLSLRLAGTLGLFTPRNKTVPDNDAFLHLL
jgi:hypothetical protein